MAEISRVRPGDTKTLAETLKDAPPDWLASRTYILLLPADETDDASIEGYRMLAAGVPKLLMAMLRSAAVQIVADVGEAQSLDEAVPDAATGGGND